MILILPQIQFEGIPSKDAGEVHSPHEIISTAGKTGHNSRQKRNQS